MSHSQMAQLDCQCHGLLQVLYSKDDYIICHWDSPRHHQDTGYRVTRHLACLWKTRLLESDGLDLGPSYNHLRGPWPWMRCSVLCISFFFCEMGIIITPWVNMCKALKTMSGTPEMLKNFIITIIILVVYYVGKSISLTQNWMLRERWKYYWNT